jgi:hypothetical protein
MQSEGANRLSDVGRWTLTNWNCMRIFGCSGESGFELNHPANTEHCRGEARELLAADTLKYRGVSVDLSDLAFSGFQQLKQFLGQARSLNGQIFATPRGSPQHTEGKDTRQAVPQ